MTRGMYAAAGGMLIGLTKQEALSNNLANVNSPGFRADRVTYGSFQSVLLPLVEDGRGGTARIYQSATVNPTLVDLAQGGLAETGNPFDLAVEGEGWFVLEAPDGGEVYTRNGHFTVAADGTLVNSEGLPVLSNNGPVRSPDRTLTVTEDGDLHTTGGQYLGQLRLVRFTEPDTLVKLGGTLVNGGAPEPVLGSRVRQGMLEQSNVDTMRTMVEMIAAMRSYETSQRVIQAQDQTLGQIIEAAKR